MTGRGRARSRINCDGSNPLFVVAVDAVVKMEVELSTDVPCRNDGGRNSHGLVVVTEEGGESFINRCDAVISSSERMDATVTFV